MPTRQGKSGVFTVCRELPRQSSVGIVDWIVVRVVECVGVVDGNGSSAACLKLSKGRFWEFWGYAVQLSRHAYVHAYAKSISGTRAAQRDSHGGNGQGV